MPEQFMECGGLPPLFFLPSTHLGSGGRAFFGVRQLAAAFLRYAHCSILGEVQQGKAMPEHPVRVETYSGYKADERPLRLHLRERVLEVAEVEDRWYSPGETYFRVLTSDGDRYVLRHTEAQDVWSLIGYRRT